MTNYHSTALALTGTEKHWSGDAPSANPRRSVLASLAGALLVGASTFTALADYPATIFSDSPAGYWRLGELPLTYSDPYLVTNSGSLGTAADGVFGGFVTRGAPGALVGSADTAFEFTSANLSRVTIGSPGSFNFTGTRSFTLETWAKPTIAPTGSQRLIANGSSGQGYAFCFQDSSALRVTGFGFADVTSDLAPAPWSTNQWYHLVLVRSNTLVYFYTNGVQFGSPKTLANIITTANPLTLGRTAAGGEPFTGVMDETAVYTNVLTAAQVAAHYANGLTNGAGYSGVIVTDGPIGYWRLNQPKKPESPTVIANTGSLGAGGNGRVFGSLNSVVGGSAGAVTGDTNTAMVFNGPDGKIDVPYSTGLNPLSFTVECWARVDAWANTHQSPVSSRNSSTTGLRGYILYAAPSTGSAPRWEFWTGSGTAFPATSGPGPDVTLGQWAHLVGTYDAANQIKLLYVDGQLVGGNVKTAVVTDDVTPLRIGAGANESVFGNYFLNGAVDEVAVYPGALGPQRVQAHYEAAKGTSPAVVAAPGVVVDPVGQTNWAPYPVTVSCVVTGSLPMQLQWYHISADGLSTNTVAGGTNLVLTLNPTAASHTGYYCLTATNALGGSESAWAWVEITPPTPPAFALDLPATLPVYVGGTAGLDVAAHGTPPITYLLQSNTVTIAVSTNGFLKVPNVRTTYASVNYRVLATNLFGVTPSANCNLQVLTAPASTYAAVITNLNPAGYWRLGEDSGTTAFDHWAGINGDYVTAYPNTLPGALVDDDDGCVQEYGAGSYVRMRDAKAFNYNGTTNRFSLAAWIRADFWPATGVRFFSTRLLVGATGGYGFGIWNGNSFRFTAFGVTDVAQGLPTVNVGQWYHVAAVCSNQTVYFYLNGVYQGSGSGTIGATGIKTSPWPLQLGGSPNFASAADEEPFTGQMDEAAVFGRVLTAAEIKALYDSRYGSLVPPTFVQEPASVQLLTGGTARFSVEATGSSPLAYQWKSNGVAIAGATTTSLTVPGITVGMGGVNYSVTVTNRAGTTNSANASITVLTPTGYAAAVVQDNPAGLWRLGEASASTTIYDTWGSHNGTPIGNVTLGSPGAINGDPNTAATFDGSTPTKVEVPYAPELNGTNFSVECWARVTGAAGSYRSPVSSRNEVQGANQGGFILYATAANVWSFWTGGTGWESLDGPAVVENEWAHLVATFDGFNKRFFVNGVLVGTAPASVVPNPIRPLRIGAGQNELDPGDYFFPGDVDEVAVYSYAVSANRVAYHYGLGKYGTNTPPFIVQQPGSPTVPVGSTVNLTVSAAGSPVLAYQWNHGGSPLPGAVQPTLTLTNVPFAAAGTYSVQVRNGAGVTNSTSATLVVMPPPTFANLTNDLVLHLRFDSDYLDTSGRTNDAYAPAGSPTFLPGKIGQGVHVATTPNNNYLQVNDLAGDLTFDETASFSVAFWLKYTGGFNDVPIIGNAVNSTWQLGWVFTESTTAGTIEWSLVSTANTGTYLRDPVPGCPIINNDAWHNVLGVVDRAANATSVYVDGLLAGSWSLAGLGTLATGQTLTIGQDPTGGYGTATFDLDDLGIWRRTLSSYEAASLYAAGQQGRSFDVYGPVILTLQKSGTDLELSWQAGTLQQNNDLRNPVGWIKVPGASAPYFKVTPGAGSLFYRVKL